MDHHVDDKERFMVWRVQRITNIWQSLKPAFHDTDIDTDTDILASILADTSDTRDFSKLFLWQAERGSRPTRQHPRDDPREDVGVGVVECGLKPTQTYQPWCFWSHRSQYYYWTPSPCSCCYDSQASLCLTANDPVKTLLDVAQSNWIWSLRPDYWPSDVPRNERRRPLENTGTAPCTRLRSRRQSNCIRV